MASAAVAAAQSAPMPGTEWYYADGIIQPDGVTLKEARKGVWAPSKEWMVLFNPGPRDVTVTATFFFEDLGPRTKTQTVKAHSSGYIVVHEIPGIVPPGKLYGVRVRSTAPVIVQPTRGEYEPNNPVTAGMASKIAYPGPLGKRGTRWAYADGVVLSSPNGPLEEWEWITILNPHQNRNAAVRVSFHWADQQQTHSLNVPAERVTSVDLFNLLVVPKNKLFGATIESDVPVVVEEVRRCYAKGIPVIKSMFDVIAYPIGDWKLE